MGALKSTHCDKGHPMKEPNLYWRNDGKRQCKTCALERANKRNKKVRGKC